MSDITCPYCRATLSAAGVEGGARTRCPVCGGALAGSPAERPEPAPLSPPARLPVRLRRLLADADQMRQAAARSSVFRIASTQGEPPELYLIEYRVRGLARGPGGEPAPRDVHRVEIQLTAEYPRVSPRCRPLTPIFHPNIDPTTVCVGDHWAAGERLVDLVVRIGEMIAYQAYNIKSPLDGEAAMWADLNQRRLPIDDRDLHPPDAGHDAEGVERADPARTVHWAAPVEADPEPIQDEPAPVQAEPAAQLLTVPPSAAAPPRPKRATRRWARPVTLLALAAVLGVLGFSAYRVVTPPTASKVAVDPKGGVPVTPPAKGPMVSKPAVDPKGSVTVTPPANAQAGSTGSKAAVSRKESVTFITLPGDAAAPPTGGKPAVDPKGGVTFTLPDNAPAAPTGSKGAVDPKGGVTVTPPGDSPAAAPAEITNSIGMKLKLIKPGKYLMGSPKDEDGRYDNEGPQHEVEITQPFYMGVYPVTRGQFAAFVKDKGYQTGAEKRDSGFGYNASKKSFESGKYSWGDLGFAQTDAHPVVEVDWNDAQAFCAWLSQKEGKVYELPTEAEWEYACRAGTTTRFWCGDADESLKGNANIGDASFKDKYPARLGPCPGMMAMRSRRR